MKKILALVICLLMLVGIASADIPDISNLTDDELVALNIAIIGKLMDSGYLKEVKVPAGIYTVGQDIPAGNYLIENTDKGSWADDVNIYFDGKVEAFGYDSHFSLEEGETAKVDLKDGYVIQLETTCIFSRFTGFGF